MLLLILGSNGMLGHALLSYWNAFCPDDKVIGLDLPELDLGNRLTTMDHIETIRPDVIINAAGITDINWLESHPNSARTIHIVGTAAIRDAARITGSRFVQISCAEVFHRDSPTEDTLPREDDLPEPKSVFGQTKREQERIALESDSLVIRTGLLFDDLRPNAPGNVVESILRVARRTRRFSVLSDVTTSLTRTRDLVRGLAALVTAEKTGLWHLAGGGTPTLYEIAQFLLTEKNMTGYTLSPISLQEYGHPAPHSRSTTLNTEKYHNDPACPPFTHWTDALHEWFLEQDEK